MSNKGEKRDYSENSFLQNWLKRNKQSSTQIANVASNDLQDQSLNDSQQSISAATSLTSNITAVSSSLSESQSN
jgi:hypothetical protein